MESRAAHPELTAVVFSKDRPLQLHAAVASLRATCTDPERLRVRALVFASTDEMARRYHTVGRELPYLDLVPETDFRATTLEVTRGARYLGFVVDDAIFVRPWSARAAVDALEHIPQALGVSLRLGKNTTTCYTLQKAQPVPPVVAAGPWLAFEWTRAVLDFGYPLELSSSVYRGEDLSPLLEELAFRNPNELEASLARRCLRFKDTRPVLLMAEKSLAFCAPLNMVQTAFPNRAGNRAEYSIEALGALFDEGGRVDVQALRGFTPKACHQEIELPLRRIEGRAPAKRPTAGEEVAAHPSPAVSVVIPCYRQAEYLGMAISSLAMQRWKDFEVVVVNDGSPDDTSDLVRRLAAQFPQLRLRLLVEQNAGLANARNAGIRAAHGRYLLPLDADDALDPEFLARTVPTLEADPGLSIVSTDVALFGARTGVWSTDRPFDLAHLVEANGLAYCSLYRREVWERTGGYRANMSAGYEDWDFWVGAAEAGFRCAHHAEPLFLYREKAASMLGDARRHHRALRAQLLLNHPGLLDDAGRAEATRILAEAPLPPAKAATEAQEIPLAHSPAASGPGLTRAGAEWTRAPLPRPGPDSPQPGERRCSLPADPADPAESLRVLQRAGAWSVGTPLRLHLGCGERRIEGYVNVDLAPGAQSIMATRADVFGDVAELRFPAASVDEVRSHHVFEHFPRVEALALLVRWHEWLRLGGRLVIETPDLEGSARTLLSDQPFEVKMGVVRHLAGDQAEGWAFHVDHWFPARYQRTLEALGFGEVQIQQTTWSRPPYLANVVAAAKKVQELPRAELLERVDGLLGLSLVAPEERATLERWRTQLRERLGGGPALRAASALPQGRSPAAVPSAAGASSSAGDLGAWIASRGSREPRGEIVDFNQRARDRWVAGRAASVAPGARVLDVGAGTCPYRRRFAHCQYVAHDFKAYQGEKLGGGKEYGRIDLVSDITAIPAPDASFDVVLCTEVLEHVPDPAAAVAEMARLLRRGGRLFLTAPLGSGLHQLPYHFFGGFAPAWYGEQARRLGLEVESITPNGGFFRLLAQETARAADLLAAGDPLEKPAPDVLRLLGDLLPRWFFALDDRRFVDQFTVGYFVEARRPI